MSFRRDMQESAGAGFSVSTFLLIVALAVLLLGGIFTVAQLGLLPFVRQQETAINRSSQGYVEAKQQQLLGLAQDYRRGEAEIARARQAGQNPQALEAQQQATLDRMETEARLLQPGDVPDPVRVILQTNGRYL
jgi:hypothetical protein